MAVVTISRELGSRGTRIAEAAAAALGAICVDKEVIADVARDAGLSMDVLVEAEERLLSKPALVSQEMRSLLKARQRSQTGVMTETQFIEQLSDVIHLLAERGDIVFVGRGSQLILGDYPQALHVHIYASPEVRAARIQRRRALNDVAIAGRVVSQADTQRRQWFRRFFGGVDWKSYQHYHLMIDTGRIDVDLAVSTIVQAARAPMPI